MGNIGVVVLEACIGKEEELAFEGAVRVLVPHENAEPELTPEGRQLGELSRGHGPAEAAAPLVTLAFRKTARAQQAGEGQTSRLRVIELIEGRLLPDGIRLPGSDP